MNKQTIVAALILTTIAGAGIYSQISTVDTTKEYSFDPGLKIWTNAAGSQIDARYLTCNYSKISDISRMIQSGQYKETVSVTPNQNIIISVTGGATTLYQVSIDSKSKATLKEVK
jgi:hypothetical protein